MTDAAVIDPIAEIERLRAEVEALRRRAEAAEAALAKAMELVAMIDRTLSDPATFAGDAAKAAALGRRRQDAQAALEAAEREWIEAQEAYEALR